MKSLVQLSIAGTKTLRLLNFEDRYQIEMRQIGTIPAHEEWIVPTDIHDKECRYSKTKDGLQEALQAFHDISENLVLNTDSIPEH